MPSNWFSTAPTFKLWSKQKKYSPVIEYRDDSSIDGEKGELLNERNSLSIVSDDSSPPTRSPSKFLHRMSIGLNVILLCISFALIILSWPELVMRYDKFNNGLLKRTSKPCMLLLINTSILQFLNFFNSSNPE